MGGKDSDNRKDSEGPQELGFADAATWREWLETNHERTVGVWLRLAKKRSGSSTTSPAGLTYADALQEALCFGWIDGQARSIDENHYFVRFTPRRPRSSWSKRNVGYVAKLIEEGRMREPGLAAIEAAKADGRWERAYDGPATIKVPDDLVAALAENPKAAAMFEVLTSSNRFTILHRIHDAKRAETRARRIAGFVEMLAQGETPYPQKARPSD